MEKNGEQSKIDFEQLDIELKKHSNRAKDKGFGKYDISELLDLVGIPNKVIRQYELYLKIFQIMTKEDIPLFEHDLTNEIASIIQTIILIYANLKHVDKFDIKNIDIICDKITQSLSYFIERNIRLLKEIGRNDLVSQIEQITGSNFSNSISLNTIDVLKQRIVSELSHWLELKGFNFGIRESKEEEEGGNEEIVIDFLDSDLNVPNSQEFLIIIENLIRNSIKSYDKGRKPKDGEKFRIVCLIKNGGNGKIQFAIGDNGGGLDWKNLVINASKLLQDTLPGHINGIEDEVAHILREGYSSPIALTRLTVGEIQSLVFADRVSAFSTTGVGLHISKALLIKRGGEIGIEEDGRGNILFKGTYVIPNYKQDGNGSKNEDQENRKVA